MTRDAYMQDVGEWIFRQRTALGMKQAALAQAIGVSEASISKWEAGIGTLSSYSHARLRSYFAAQKESSAKA
jgi:transcriptional regulator with XRE-family HTH domain